MPDSSPSPQTSGATDFASIALLNHEQCTELFADQGDPELTEMQREIWVGVSAELRNDLHALGDLSGPALRASLHRIRGYSSTTSLQRLEAILRAWEDSPSPEASTQAFLPVALETCDASLEAINASFPHLSGTGHPPAA